MNASKRKPYQAVSFKTWHTPGRDKMTVAVYPPHNKKPFMFLADVAQCFAWNNTAAFDILTIKLTEPH